MLVVDRNDDIDEVGSGLKGGLPRLSASNCDQRDDRETLHAKIVAYRSTPDKLESHEGLDERGSKFLQRFLKFLRVNAK